MNQTETPKLSRAEQLKLIQRAYDALPDMTRGFTDWKRRLFNMNLDSERKHRSGGHPSCGISKEVAARLFTVQHIADALEKPNRFTAQDILSIRNERLYAQALAHKSQFRAEIKAAWKQAGVKSPDMAQVDYAELMKVGGGE